MPQRQHDDSLAWFPEDLENPEFERLMPENGDIDNFVKQHLRGKIKITQLRKFFDEIVSIERKLDKPDFNLDAELALLIPKVKFAKARRLCPDDFVKLISKIQKGVNEDGGNKIKRFKNARKILEAVVAYCKYYGGD
ncbi:MAG: type III-A CRISPR-associated protein Csm2 [Candidatus Cloacimonas sp. 4484_209]|nr:MAG: type III-A CRISPR-associated protein Csm2 [Candidatus Cloacimonas sp. 4484_209]